MFSGKVVLFGSIWSICWLYHLAKSCAHLKSCETLQVLQEISCAKVPFIGTGSQLEDVCQFPWNPHSFQQQNSRSCMVWRISSVFSASLRSVSGSVHLFLEWTNFLNKVMVLPQFCVESFFRAKGGDSTVIIQINYTSLTVSIFHQIGWSRIWLLHRQIPKKRRGTLRTFGVRIVWFFASTKSDFCKWEAKLWSRPYEGSSPKYGSCRPQASSNDYMLCKETTWVMDDKNPMTKQPTQTSCQGTVSVSVFFQDTLGWILTEHVGLRRGSKWQTMIEHMTMQQNFGSTVVGKRETSCFTKESQCRYSIQDNSNTPLEHTRTNPPFASYEKGVPFVACW